MLLDQVQQVPAITMIQGNECKTFRKTHMYDKINFRSLTFLHRGQPVEFLWWNCCIRLAILNACKRIGLLQIHTVVFETIAFFVFNLFILSFPCSSTDFRLTAISSVISPNGRSKINKIYIYESFVSLLPHFARQEQNKQQQQ